jgi:8-oxo-dGTP diphosphatase
VTVLGSRVVVGAAIIRDRRVLAARRRVPEALAGGWEFPGGKVADGESDTAALVRECREELAIGIACRERIPGEWPIDSALVLRVFRAEILEGEPLVGADHDQLRWLCRDEIFDVEWLPADLLAATALAELFE